MDHLRLLSPKQARVLTDRIVTTPKDRWARIAEVHARHGAEALGYPTWADYCDAEFGPERFRIPQRHRFQILTELKEAGLTFEEVEVAVIPRALTNGSTVVGLDKPANGVGPLAPSVSDASDPGITVDGLGFAPDELGLIATLLEVSDDEFRRVLTVGRERGNLTAQFVRTQCDASIARRDTLEHNLDRALRSVERAQELLRRCRPDGPTSVAVSDLVKLLEDQAWDLIDNIDRLHGQLDHRHTTAN